MPLARAATTVQDLTCSRRNSERKSASRAASVPVDQRESSRLESLRSKKQKRSLLDVEDATPSSLPTVAIARGHKRDGAHVSSQTDGAASASASVTEQTADASEQRPRKRHKRALSTPPAPRPSLPSTQLRSRRRSRSRVGLPSKDVECVLPSRRSARLARKIHPFFDSLSSNIYNHLADPDDAGRLLSEPAVSSSVMLSSPNEAIESQSVKRPRGRRRNKPDLADENAKKDLMKEWARMRQSQGTLSLSGINEKACSSQTRSRGHQTGGESVSSAMFRRVSLGVDPVESGTTTIVDLSQSQEFSPTQIDSGDALSVGVGASGEKLGYNVSVLPSDGGTEQPTVPAFDIEVPLTSILDAHSPTHRLAGALETPRSQSTSASPSRAVPVRHEKSAQLSTSERAGAASLNDPPKDKKLVPVPQTLPLDANSTHLDSDEEFYMFDIPEIFTLPWVPVSSHLYVPPSLGKLISGMREQLMMEARTRRKAEELHQAELSRRISAEKVIEDLRTQLEDKRQDLPGKQAERQ